MFIVKVHISHGILNDQITCPNPLGLHVIQVDASESLVFLGNWVTFEEYLAGKKGTFLCWSYQEVRTKKPGSCTVWRFNRGRVGNVVFSHMSHIIRHFGGIPWPIREISEGFGLSFFCTPTCFTTWDLLVPKLDISQLPGEKKEVRNEATSLNQHRETKNRNRGGLY